MWLDPTMNCYLLFMYLSGIHIKFCYHLYSWLSWLEQEIYENSAYNLNLEQILNATHIMYM